MHRGSCLCGNVKYELSAELGDFGYCHCKSCQKASGSAYAANAPIASRDFHLLSGEDTLREYESSPDKLRVFCARCGSPIYAFLRASPGVLRVRLGTLDTPLDKHPKVHTFVSEKATWEPLNDDLPKFDGWAPREVLVQKGSRQP